MVVRKNRKVVPKKVLEMHSTFLAFTLPCTVVRKNRRVVPKNTAPLAEPLWLEPNNTKPLRNKVVWTMCNLNPSPGISMFVIIELV